MHSSIFISYFRTNILIKLNIILAAITPSRFNLLPLHRKGAGVKYLRKYAKVHEKNAKLSNSNISDILNL